MIQTIFETKQRAKELLQKAIEIWRSSDQNDHLEGIEDDPVFSLLITALAYQANETEAEIDQMKQELLEEFASMQVPFEMGHAMPASAVVATALQGEIPEMQLTADHVFSLGYNGAGFIPLLQTRVLGCTGYTVTRLDGRRWKVDIAFNSPVTDLSGFSFAIRDHNYRDLRVTVQGRPLPLIGPQDYSELPLSPCFALDTMLYNKSQTYMASSLCLDLFARQNVRMYCVKRHQPKQLLPIETEHVELVFEFSGIGGHFEFDRTNLSLNAVILVNARQQTALLSTDSPVVRVAGYHLQNTNPTETREQFLHLLRPSENQLHRDMQIEVRRLSADRFNQGQLVTALNHMLSKYFSDYMAFLNIGKVANDTVMNGLAQTLEQLIDAARAQDTNNLQGVYLMLRPTIEQRSSKASIEVTYMTTSGAAINDQLTDEARFIPPSGFDAAATIQIASPVQGFDEVRDERTMAGLTRYYSVTNDRLVTPADIKLFCYHELLMRYGIVSDMVTGLTVSRRQQFEYGTVGYEILVEIELADNSFVRRSLVDKIGRVEQLFESMINVRTTNIYPVSVSIRIATEKNKHI